MCELGDGNIRTIAFDPDELFIDRVAGCGTGTRLVVPVIERGEGRKGCLHVGDGKRRDECLDLCLVTNRGVWESRDIHVSLIETRIKEVKAYM